MQWLPEDLYCNVRLPEPGTAAEWIEGGFGSSCSHGEVAPLIQTPFWWFLLLFFFLLGGDGLY